MIFSDIILGFPSGSGGKESVCNVGDLGSIPGLGRSPGEGKGYPLQVSGLVILWTTVMGSQRVGHDWVTFILFATSHNVIYIHVMMHMENDKWLKLSMVTGTDSEDVAVSGPSWQLQSAERTSDIMTLWPHQAHHHAEDSKRIFWSIQLSATGLSCLGRPGLPVDPAAPLLLHIACGVPWATFPQHPRQQISNQPQRVDFLQHVLLVWQHTNFTATQWDTAVSPTRSWSRA